MSISISAEELVDKMQANSINLLDIRDKYQYLMEHIPGAVSAPKQLLTMMPEQFMNKQDIYYLYCNYGVTSRKIAASLRMKGYNVFTIDGGFVDYKNVK